MMQSSQEQPSRQPGSTCERNASESASKLVDHEASDNIALNEVGNGACDNITSNHVDHEANDEVAKEQIAAAQALMELHSDSVFTIRRLVNRHHGNFGAAVKAVLQQGFEHPLRQVKSASEIERDKRDRVKKERLDTALTLIKLSGQSRAESRAALALLHLRQECIVYLAQQLRKKIPFAQLALREKDAAERFLALKKFHQQYPAVLRTSRRKIGQRANETES